MKEGLRQCIRPLGGECSPGLDEIRRVPVLRIPTASYGPFEQSGFRYAVLTVLSSSLIQCRPRWDKFDSAGEQNCLCRHFLGYYSIILAGRKDCPRDPGQFVCGCHDQYISWRSAL